MYISPTYPCLQKKNQRIPSGFALVSVLLVLAVLALFTLSVLQLSKSESTRAHQSSHQLAAEANAKLALQIALSQLQYYTGRDQTTTSRADLLDERLHPTEETDPSLLHPYYTLAYQTAPVDGGHQNYGKGVFLRVPEATPACLVSGNEAFDLLSHPTPLYPEKYFTPSTKLDPNKSINLLTYKKKSVTVPLISIKSPNGNQGHYAYWIGDQNIKARINLKDHDADQNKDLAKRKDPGAKAFNTLRAPHALGRPAAGKDETEEFLKEIEHPENHLTPATIAIHGEKQSHGIQQHYHDFTTYSQSVLCDLKHGGLKKNLTAAINLSDQEFENLTKHTGDEENHPSPVFLYQGWSFPAEKKTLSYSHYPGVLWELFRSYVRRPEFEPDLTGSNVEVLSHLGTKAHKLRSYWQSRAKDKNSPHFLDARLIRRSPALLRFQVGIDYSIGYIGTVKDSEIGHESYIFELRQHFTPLVSYWNPCNVDLTISEPIEYHIYLDRGYNSGRHNTHFRAHFPDAVSWKILALHSDKKKQELKEPVTSGSAEFFYPYHPNGNDVSASTLSRCSFLVPSFTLKAGKTVTFTTGSNSKVFQYGKQENNLEKLTNINQHGHSFYTSNARFTISAAHFSDYRQAIPELEILSYPSDAGAQRTRLHVRNSSSFHRINWNFSSISKAASLRFIPTLLEAGAPLPQSDENGTETPKLSGVVIRKFADIDHYLPHHETWKTPTTSTNSNAYLAPWSTFYQLNASRYSAYGAKESYDDSFSSPPQYLTGVLVGSSPILQPDTTATFESYLGYSDRSAGGSTESIQIALPRHETRCFSPAHLSQINTGKWLSNYNSQQSNASATDALCSSDSIANSFCSPHIPPMSSHVTVYDKHAFASSPTATQYDNSFRYNESLWDRYFFTGLREGDLTESSNIAKDLPAHHLKPINQIDLETLTDPHRSSSKLMLEGGFNINSTSVEAWKTLLASTIGKQVSPQSPVPENLTPFPRLQYTPSSPYSTPPSDPSLAQYYNGKFYRALTTDELHTLAEKIVIQNKLRGPYSTLSQFINRSLNPDHHYRKSITGLPLTSDQVCYEGPLQAAINAAKINGAFNTSNAKFPPEITTSEHTITDYEAGKINPKALKYHSGYGSSGTLTQADILMRIGHLLTARSDTFTIRAYGDSRNAKGEVMASSYCEAVVQRFPEYMDPSDSPETPPQRWTLEKPVDPDLPNQGTWNPNPNLSPLSKKLGRRYKILQFRWLHPEEI